MLLSPPLQVSQRPPPPPKKSELPSSALLLLLLLLLLRERQVPVSRPCLAQRAVSTTTAAGQEERMKDPSEASGSPWSTPTTTTATLWGSGLLDSLLLLLLRPGSGRSKAPGGASWAMEEEE